MKAPDRSREVREILGTVPVAVKTVADVGRRTNLFLIARVLNRLEASPEWGVLTKTDQGNKIPGDILVWRSTMEHFDVITGAGLPAWQPDGIVPSARWIWTAVDGEGPPPPPPPPPPASATLEEVADRLTLIEGELVALRHLLQQLRDVQGLGLGGTIRFLGRDYPVLLTPPKPKGGTP